jgi:hypothetical protein
LYSFDRLKKSNKNGKQDNIYTYTYILSTVEMIKIATFKDYIYFSGGGGGKTGIPNEIVIDGDINS